MDQDAKARFILALHKHSLAAFASGGDTYNASMSPSPGGGAQGDPNGSNAPQGNGAKAIDESRTNSMGQFFNGVGSLVGKAIPQNDFQAQLAPQDITSYSPYIDPAAKNSLTGYGNTAQYLGQQQAFANQLQDQANGAGPNPAQAALNQSTGQNVANQAALMAGQRGASANPGLIARQAAQQGAATQQNAVGQSATLQAQQQIAAQKELQAQQQLMANTNLQQQGYSNQLFGTAAGAQNAQNANQITNYNDAQSINAGVAGQNAQAKQGLFGGVLGGIGAALALSEGGEVDKIGDSPDQASKFAPINTGSQTVKETKSSPAPSSGPGALQQGSQSFIEGITSSLGFAKGGMVNLPPHLHAVAQIYHGHKMSPVRNMESGGAVPGKAPVKNNSPKNDKIPALLSAKEIVLPRSITTHPNAPQKAAEFVQAVLNKRRMGGKK